MKRFGKDSMGYVPGKIIVGLAGIVSVTLYSRIFSPADYGNYSLVSGTLTLMIAVLTGWMSQATLRFNDDYNEKKGRYFTTIVITLIVINIFVLLLTVVGISIFRAYFEPQIIKLCYLGILLFFVQSIDSSLKSILRAERRIKIYSFNNTLVAISKVVLVYILTIWFELNTESIIISLIIGYICSNIITFKTLNIFRELDYKLYDIGILSDFMKYGFPLLGLSFTAWMLSASDKYIIKIFGTSSEVGIYSISYSVASSIFNLIITMMMLGAFPLIIKTWNTQGKKETEKVVAEILRYYLIITVPAFFGVLSLSREIIQVLGGQEYMEGYYILPIVSLGMFFIGISQYTNKIWELRKNTNIILYLNAIAAILNVALNIIFVPKFGYIAAAFTTTLSYAVYLAISLLKSKRIFEIKLRIRTIINIVLSSITMAIVVKLMVGNNKSALISLILGIGIGGVCFFCMLYLLGEIKEEVKLIKELLRSITKKNLHLKNKTI